MYQDPPTLTDIINKLDEIIKEQQEFIDYIKTKNETEKDIWSHLRNQLNEQTNG